VTCRNLSFQLELMGHDPVMRESFQKLSDWICRDLAQDLDGISSEIPVSPPDAILLRDCLCDVSVYIGAAVKSFGSICYNAQADSIANSRVIGFAISKSSATRCDVLLCGQTGDIYSGLNVSDDYFLSPTVAGGLQTAVPTGAGHVVAFLGRTISAKNLVVNIALRLQRAL